MAKSFEEIEQDFQARYPKVAKKSKKVSSRKQKKAIQEEVSPSKQKETTPKDTTQNDTVSISILGIIFYLVLAIMVVGTIVFSKEVLGNRVIGGRHFYEVTTTSMQSAYPQGSMVFALDIEPNVLMVGDDIIFQNEDNKISITRIIEVKAEEGTDKQVFVTLGVDEVAENIEQVPADRIKGKITGSIPFAGMIFNWIGNNLWGGFVVLGLIVATFVCTKIFRRKGKVAKKD